MGSYDFFGTSGTSPQTNGVHLSPGHYSTGTGSADGSGSGVGTYLVQDDDGVGRSAPWALGNRITALLAAAILVAVCVVGGISWTRSQTAPTGTSSSGPIPVSLDHQDIQEGRFQYPAQSRPPQHQIHMHPHVDHPQALSVAASGSSAGRGRLLMQQQQQQQQAQPRPSRQFSSPLSSSHEGRHSAAAPRALPAPPSSSLTEELRRPYYLRINSSATTVSANRTAAVDEDDQMVLLGGYTGGMASMGHYNADSNDAQRRKQIHHVRNQRRQKQLALQQVRGTSAAPNADGDSFPLVIHGRDDDLLNAGSGNTSAQQYYNLGQKPQTGQQRHAMSDHNLQFVADSYIRQRQQLRSSGKNSSCVFCAQALQVVSVVPSSAGSTAPGEVLAGPVGNIQQYLSLVLPVQTFSPGSDASSGLVEVQCKVLNVTSMPSSAVATSPMQ